MSEVKKYTNSVQHNVIATVIDAVNDKGIKLIDNSLIGSGKSLMINDHTYSINSLNSMYDFINELHNLGYQIVKKPKKVTK